AERRASQRAERDRQRAETTDAPAAASLPMDGGHSGFGTIPAGEVVELDTTSAALLGPLARPDPA
ncbi:MAG: hypothetical protein RL722_480, partial [Pseudomonadota bacterium]